MGISKDAVGRPTDEILVAICIERTEAALKTEGFGVISRIDIQQTLKTKINVDFRPYTFLGASNLPYSGAERLAYGCSDCHRQNTPETYA